MQERHAGLPSCAGTHPDAGVGTWFNENVRELHNFTTCAVVGGASVENDWGAEIDSNAAVIRFNGSPTVGFESKVRVCSRRVSFCCLPTHTHLPLHKHHAQALARILRNGQRH